MNKTKEMYDLMSEFEKFQKYGRFDKEEKVNWERGVYYQNGVINDLFNTFMGGYALAKNMAIQGHFS